MLEEKILEAGLRSMTRNHFSLFEAVVEQTAQLRLAGESENTVRKPWTVNELRNRVRTLIQEDIEIVNGLRPSDWIDSPFCDLTKEQYIELIDENHMLDAFVIYLVGFVVRFKISIFFAHTPDAHLVFDSCHEALFL